MAKETRSWQPREMQMLSEWLTKFCQGKRYQMHVRLGSPKPSVPRADMTEAELRMVGSWRRWADAVILEQNQVTIIEAAIRLNPGKIGQLELYARLFPHTPEFVAWKAAPLQLQLLYAIEDPATIQMAREKGIKCTLYEPLWLSQYLALLMPRERRGSRF